MSIEALNDLESKVDTLIEAFSHLKQESETLRSELEQKNNVIGDLENRNQGLSEELNQLRGSLDEREKKLDVAAERIQEILRKLEPLN